MKNKFSIAFLILVVLLVLNCKGNSEEIIEKEEPIATEEVHTDTVSDSIETAIDVDVPISEKYDLPFEIEGIYRFEDEVASCKMHLEIFSVKGVLKYKWDTGTRIVSDDVEISKEENGEFYITFKNMEWSENKGLIDPEGITPEENLPIPTEIMAGLRDNQIIFQNYGNAENYFVILKECDVKYIFFEKI